MPRRSHRDRPVTQQLPSAILDQPPESRPAFPHRHAPEAAHYLEISRMVPTSAQPDVLPTTAADTSAPTIQGWRLIVSDEGRFWAIRNRAFSRTALRAGAEPAVDADTLAEVREAVARQEEIAKGVTP